jgi:hypothetical protein
MLSALMKRKRDSEVAVGQRYRKRDAQLIVWEVISVFVGTDGMPYAGIVRVDDRTMRKTVASAALSGGTQYQRVR